MKRKWISFQINTLPYLLKKIEKEEDNGWTVFNIFQDRTDEFGNWSAILFKDEPLPKSEDGK